MYTAVVLTAESQTRLKERFAPAIPAGWEIVAHHMTTNMGRANEDVQPFLGQIVELHVKSLASNDLVAALGVECDVPSANAHKHITLAVNRLGGGKPKHSNDLMDWQQVEPLVLTGQVVEVS